MSFTLIIRLGTIFLLLFGLEIHAQIPGMPTMPLKETKNIFGGTNADLAFSIIQTADGGYISAGYTNSNNNDVSGNHGNIDVWVLKLNSQWKIQWQKTLGGSGNEGAACIIQTNDGGYIIAGKTDSADGDISGYHGGDRNMWIIKLSNTGAIQWEKNYGGSLEDRAQSIVQTADGGYAVAGYSGSSDGDASLNKGSLDVWIVKLASNGALQWEKSFGGSGNDLGNCIIQTSDGGYAVSGLSNSNDGDVSGNHGNLDFWVLKISNTGMLEWQKTLGGTGNEGSASLLQTADGGYAVTGITESNDGDVSGNHGQEDIWILKLNATGILQWSKTIGGTGSDQAYAMIKTADGKYAIAGASSSNDGDVTENRGADDCWIVKINAAGNTIEWQRTIGGTSNEQAHSLIQTTNGHYIIAGYSMSGNGEISGMPYGMEDFFISELDAAGSVIRMFDDTNL